LMCDMIHYTFVLIDGRRVPSLYFPGDYDSCNFHSVNGAWFYCAK
jgi:hypothetical protein